MTVYVPPGLDNTGVTDITTTFKNWVAASVPNGTAGNPSQIQFPAGTYKVTSMLDFSNRSYLTFESTSAVLGGNVTFNWTPTLTQSGGYWSGNDSLRCFSFADCSNL